jgi:ATP-dependent protease ClpP protease subunit
MINVIARGSRRAEILVYESIGQDWFGEGLTAKRFRKDLDALGELDEITVRINSPGGEVFDGLSIYNTLKQHAARKIVHVDGLAASIASVIAMAGDEVRMGEGAMFMVHSPFTLAMGNAENLREAADALDKIEVGLVDAYVARTKKPRADVERWMEGETWFTREEAIEAGLADSAEASTAPQDVAAHTRATFAAFQLKAVASADLPSLRRALNACNPFQPATAGVSSVETGTPNPQEKTMSVENKTSVPATDPVAVQAAIDAAFRAEEQRQTEIRAAFGRFAAQHPDLLENCLKDRQVTAAVAGQRLLAKLGEAAEPLAPRTVQITADAREKFVNGAVRAIMARAALEKPETGNEFNGMGLTDLAAHALGLINVSCRGLSRDGIARKVLATHSSSDFPLLLANAAGKVLRAAYAAAPVTWNRWCKVGSVSDFKVASRHTLGSFSSLLTKPELGEYKQGTMSEERETIQAATKGRYIGISREMIVNDDLNAFTGMSQKMGRAAARTVEADVYALLTSASGAGPAMSDTGAFFNSTAITTAGGHANLGSGAITVANIAAAEAAMMKQKDKGLNDFIVLQPRFLVVSPDRKQVAWEVLNSLTDVSQQNSAKRNYVQAQLNLEVVSSPYLTTAAPWYLFTDPADVEAFEVAFLDGVQEPFIDEEVEFMTDAMNMKVRLDYGVAAIDWRAGYRSTGV